MSMLLYMLSKNLAYNYQADIYVFLRFLLGGWELRVKGSGVAPGLSKQQEELE